MHGPHCFLLRFQHIYACGAPIALPAVHARTTAAQALLHIASRLATAPRPLLDDAAAVLEPPAQQSPGGYCGLRLLPGEALSASVPSLRLRLARELVDAPPYELRWLRQHPLKVRFVFGVASALAGSLPLALLPRFCILRIWWQAADKCYASVGTYCPSEH